MIEESLSLAGIIFILTEAIKETKKIPTGWLPAVSILIGGTVCPLINLEALGGNLWLYLAKYIFLGIQTAGVLTFGVHMVGKKKKLKYLDLNKRSKFDKM
jgi:hypothetical protein